MQAFLASAESIVVLIGIAAIGFFAVARKLIPADSMKALSTVAVDIAVPLYIFTNIIEKFDPASSPDWWKLPLWWVGFAAATLLLSILFSRLFKKDIRSEAALSLYLYNPVFVPLAVLIGVYGTDSPYIADLFLFTIFAATYFLNIYPIFYRKTGLSPKHKINWKKVFNPLILITLLAVVLHLVGAVSYIPGFIITITHYVGNMAFPLIMFIVGSYVYLDMKDTGKISWRPIIQYVIAKNFLFPLIALGFVWLVRPEKSLALLLVLSAAAPPITTIPILVKRQQGNTQIANQFLVGSFLVAIVSIPLMLMLFNSFYA